MAVTDLLVLITAVVLNRISVIYFPVLFLSTTPVCSLKITVIYIVRDCSVWLTVVFTIDRFIAICCQNFKAKYCTKKMATVVIGIVCTVSCVKNFPWYFVYEPLYLVNGVPWYCNIKLSFYTELAWTAFDWVDRILNPCSPFLIMLILNFLTVRNIVLANKARKRLRLQTIRENQIDPEMESRRKSIILLFTISGSFLLLWMTYVINFLYVRFTNSNYSTGSTGNNPRFILQEGGNMLQLLSCCTNTCIYAATQSKFREEFKNALKYPLKWIIKIFKL
ncbi:probable G-protein coupled receptor 139 [Rhincodon typus]|uniref:probable G-protein coupled receptor 139 n=1 Tax=Rhincodon typus TaxID=259920 RepID=UPI00202EDE7A|nr:probable G-protein coupled receptor 139 [Rhincodon typus]